jgi:phosphoesterase RecJ-like protein
MEKKLLAEAFNKLKAAQRILVVSHIRPDGDAVGSLIGLGLSMEDLGIEVQMVLSDGIPAIFKFLAGSEKVLKSASGNFDIIVAVDCSDIQRAGTAFNNVAVPDINLDHHPTNTGFAKINLVDESAVATSEILTEYMPQFGFPISKNVADALLFGMITDTLGFRTNNMTPKSLQLAANLMEAGGNLPQLYEKGLLSRSVEAARYWGVALSDLQQDGRIIWSTLTLADRRLVGYPGRDDADLISFLSTIEDADIALMFVEQGNGHVKVSWRSRPGLDVSKVAAHFGGGGHAAAAGAQINGKLTDIQTKVIDTTKNILGFTEGTS